MSKALAVVAFLLTSLACKDPSIQKPLPPGQRAFVVENGDVGYLIDPLNEVCLASHRYQNPNTLLTHSDCMRLIQRYTMPLTEPKAEREFP